MKLYHGTGASNLASIMERGILPRSLTGKSNWGMASNKGCVYLTTAYALYFATATSSMDDDLAVIELDSDLLDQDSLVPDEDFLEQATRRHDDLPEKWTLERRTRYYRKRLPDYAEHWELSAEHMGTCAVMGPVPPEAMTRVARVDRHKQNTLLAMALDPTITILNYRIVGDKYRAITAWLFGDDFEDTEQDRQLASLENCPSYYRPLRDVLSQLGRDGISVEEVHHAQEA